MAEISNRIKEARKLAGLSQRDFAESLGVHQGHISKIETSKASPSDSLIKLICYLFEIDEEWLKEGKGSVKSKEKLSPKEAGLSESQTDKIIYGGLINLLNSNTMVLDRMGEMLFELQFIDEVYRNPSHDLIEAKKTMIDAIEGLKHGLETFFNRIEKRERLPELIEKKHSELLKSLQKSDKKNK